MLGAMVLPAICRAETLEEVEKQIAAAYAKVKTVSAKMNSLTEMDQGGMKMKITVDGTYEAMNGPEGKRLYRMEGKSKMEMPGMENQPGGGEQEMLVICDGEYTYQMSTMMGMKNAVKTKPDIDPIPWSQMRDDQELSVLPSESVDGKECHVVEGKAKDPNATPMVRMVYYCRKDIGCPVKQVAYDKDGKVVNTTTFTDIKVDSDIAADRFKWTTPEGVTLIDQTGGQ